VGQGQGRQGASDAGTALFDRIEVLGMAEATVSLSAHAVRYGLAAVLPSELRLPVYGRGERIRAYTPSPSLLIPVANIPSYVGRVWKTA
jgi:hypothetical protein